MRSFLLALFLSTTGATFLMGAAAPAAKPAKKLSKKDAAKKAAEEAAAKAKADAEAAEAAKKAEAEAAVAAEARRIEAEKAEVARKEEEAKKTAEAEAAAAAAKAEEEKKAAEAAQAASMRAVEEEKLKTEKAALEAKAAADAADAEASKVEWFYTRAAFGTEMYNLPYLSLNGIPAAQKRGFGLSLDGAVGFRFGVPRIGVEYQHTWLPQSAAWNKFLLALDFAVPVSIVDVFVGIALGYSNLAADGASFHGGAAKARAGVDVRVLRYMSVGVGGDFDLTMHFLGILPQGSYGMSLLGRVAFRL